MAYKTKLQVETKIKRDLDLEQETFIQPAELTEYFNDALTIVEAQINSLGLKDQYLRKRSTISLVQGTADYALPSDLHNDKIKEVVYSKGAQIYKMYPITGKDAAEEIEHLNRFSTTEYYRYRVRKDSSTENYFQVVPTARDTESDVIIVEYYRDLLRISADTDLVEVPPICLQYIYEFVKSKVYEKEGHANYPTSLAKLEKLEKLMIDSLTNQIVDESEELIEFDKSIYQEIS